MIEPSAAVSSLIGALPRGGAAGQSPLQQGGSGPAAIVELGRQRYGEVPGYNTLADLAAATTGMLQLQAGQSTAPQPIFSNKQAQQINETITAAATALQAGRFDEAESKAKELLERDFNDPVGYHLLGRIAATRGDDEQALRHLERAAALAPGNSRFTDDLFNARQLQRSDSEVLEVASELVGDRDGALNGIRLLFELAQRSDLQGRIFLTIAEGFKTLNLPAQQLKALDAVVKHGTVDDLAALQGGMAEFIRRHEPVGLAHSISGRALARLGRFPEALQELETAVGIAPETQRYRQELAGIHAALGEAALQGGDVRAAEFRYEKARELDPLNPQLKIGLADVLVTAAEEYIDRGLDSDARARLGRAKSLLGSNPVLDDQLAGAYMRLGQRALGQGLSGLALVNFEDAYQRDPTLAGLKRSMAEIHRAEGQAILDAESYADMSTADFEQVVDSFQEAYDLFPSRDSYKSTLGEVLNEFGLKLMNEQQDYERAQEMFGRARDLFPDNETYQSNYTQALDLKLANP